MDGVRNVQSTLHSKKAGGSVRVTRIPEKVSGNKQGRFGVSSRTTRKPLVFSGTKGEPDYEEFESIWDALGLSKEEAANLDARATLMIQIECIISEHRWTQAVAAKKCGVSQPRINDLMRGNIDKFSIDALVNMAAALGRRVDFQLVAA